MPGEDHHQAHGRVLPGTAVLISAAVVSLLLGAAAIGLAWRSYQTSADDARRTVGTYAYEAATSASSYLQGRVDLLRVYGSRAAFVLGDPVTADLEASGVPPTAGFDLGVLWYDANGVARAGVRGEVDTASLLRSEVQAVLASGEPRVTPVVESPELAGRAVVLLVPTRSSDGAVNGVLAGAVSVAWIDAVAEQQADRRGTESFIFDRLGSPIAVAGPGEVAVAVPPAPDEADQRGLVSLDVRSGARDPLGRPERTLGIATEPRLTGWTSVEVVPDATVLGPARRSFERSVLVVVAFVLASLLGAAFAARRGNALAARTRAAEDALRTGAERERHIATTLQASLLPRRAPAVPGLDVVARYRPAGPDVVVGGDFYDVAPLGDGRWQVMVGDVCGHGVAAAAATSLARHTLRVAGRHAGGPAEWLRWLHQELASLDGDDFVTAVAMEVVLLPDGVRVRLAVAGHPLPILLRADGSAATVGREGTLLGVVSPVLLEDEVWLRAGDRLVVYTDGLTDSALPRLHDDDVADLARLHARESTADLADALLRAAGPSGAAPYDDTAVLVLGVPAPVEPAPGGAGDCGEVQAVVGLDRIPAEGVG